MSKYSIIFADTDYFITTRPRGNIPRMKPPVDVFIEVSQEAAAAMNIASVPAYSRAIRDEGPWPVPFSFIRNRCKPYTKIGNT